VKVVLIKDVEKMGKAGDVITVRDGYGRNFLIPNKLALESGRKNMEVLEKIKKKLERKQKRQREEVDALKEKLSSLSCTIAMPTGEDEKLFGEVTAEMISNFYKQEGIDIEKRRILLEKPIRHLGVYQADVKLHPDVVATVKVWVVKK